MGYADFTSSIKTLGSPIIDGKYIFGSEKCVFILVLLCLQLY